MNQRIFLSKASRRSLTLGLSTSIVLAISTALAEPTSLGGNPSVPWECSNYSDEGQRRCLSAYIERQQEQIGKLEARLQAQQNTVGQLKGHLDQQAAAAADLQRQLFHGPVIPITPTPVYPPVGFGINLGQPWFYGSPYYWYGRPFWGPHFYRHRGRRW